MRRGTSFVLGALAFVALSTGGHALAQTGESTTTTAAPTSTTSAAPPVTVGSSTTTTPTTAKPGAVTTTTTAKPPTGKPIPPPPAGTSQTLVPSILGGTPLLDTTTTLFGVETVTVPQNPNNASADPLGNSVAVTKSSNKPNGTTLVLAAVAWLASLAGLLVYAEDQRGARWRHLAR